MAHPTQFRNFIPSGECVDGPAAPVFEAIDRGTAADETMFIAAKTACGGCVQLQSCDQQAREIADALWRNGVGRTIIGGQELTKDPGQEIPIARSIDYLPPIRFDLAKVPDDPGSKLAILRRAMCAEQLYVSGPGSHRVTDIAQTCLERLASQNIELYEGFMALPLQDRHKACRYIVTMICQQEDFTQFDTQKRLYRPSVLKARYNAETFDFDKHDGLVRLFIRDCVEIAADGFSHPGGLAAHHSPGYYRELREEYAGYMSPSRFKSILQDSLRNPALRLDEYVARMQAHQAHGTGPAWTAARRAQKQAGLDEIDHELASLEATNSGVSGAAILRTATYNKNAQKALNLEAERIAEARIIFANEPLATDKIIELFARNSAKDHLHHIEAYVHNAKILYAMYGDHPDFTSTTIDMLSRRVQHDVLHEAQAYLDRLELWRNWIIASPSVLQMGGVPNAILKKLAIRGDQESLTTLVLEYQIDRFNNRFRANNDSAKKRGKPTFPIKAWMLQRIAALYPPTEDYESTPHPFQEIDEVATNLWQLGIRGIITVAVAEPHTLREPNLHPSLRNVHGPSVYYVTFTDAMRGLSPAERLALAHKFKVTRLIYGRDFDRETIARLLDVDTFVGATTDALLAKAEALAQDKVSPTKIFMTKLNDDITLYTGRQQFAETSFLYADASPIYAPNHTTTIVGGQRMRIVLSPDLLTAETIPADLQDWLTGLVNNAYPPVAQHMAFGRAITYLQRGVLRIAKDDQDDLSLRLNKELYEMLDASDRAALIHTLGIDPLLLKRDVGNAITGRLVNKAPVNHVIEQILPKLAEHEIGATLGELILPQTGEWKDVTTALPDLEYTPDAFGAALNRNMTDTSRLWRAAGRLVCIDSALFAAVARQKLKPEPIGWYSHARIFTEPGAQSVLDTLRLSTSDYGIYRSSVTGIADIYYREYIAYKLLMALGRLPVLQAPDDEK